MTLTRIVAPILGVVIIARAGWQMAFVVMFAFGAIRAVLLVWLFLQEMLSPEKQRAKSFADVARVEGSAHVACLAGRWIIDDHTTAPEISELVKGTVH